MLFTNEKDVADVVAVTLPLVVVFLLIEAIETMSHGILRGIGRPRIGGYVVLGCFYLVVFLHLMLRQLLIYCRSDYPFPRTWFWASPWTAWTMGRSNNSYGAVSVRSVNLCTACLNTFKGSNHLGNFLLQYQLGSSCG